MPIFEFVCEKCGSTCERYFKPSMVEAVTSGEVITTCKKCGNITKLVISTCSYRMKGYNESNGYSNIGVSNVKRNFSS